MSAQAAVLPLIKPNASFMTVDPGTARRWLTCNTRNRKIRKADLERYKRDMIAGRWRLDGSPVRFGTGGELLDGQHRLTAIVETGITVPMLIVRGVDPDAQMVMDSGRKRTAADALDIAGKEFPVMAAAVARLLIEHSTARLDSGGRVEVSHEEVLAVLDENPDITSAIAFTAPLARRTDCPPAMVAYTYLVMRRIDPADAAEFWVATAEKVGLSAGDPVLALSNRLAEARRNREKISRTVYLSMIFRTWNARRKGQQLRLLRVNSSKGGVVQIPEPK